MEQTLTAGHLKLTKLSPVDILSSRVIRVLACNPGLNTLQGTNTYIVGTGQRRILIDAGDKGIQDYVTTLAKVLKDHGVDIESIVITHWHTGHAGGVNDVCTGVFKRTPENPIDVWKIERQNGKELEIGSAAKYRMLENGQVLSVEGANLRVVHTPGHSDDNISLLLEEENAMFVGDCILGETSSYFENYNDLVKSLKLLRDYKPQLLYPGHGPVVKDTVNYITSYIEHREMREKQILDTLKLSKEGGWTVDEIVQNIYEGLIAIEHKYVAKANTTNHLEKLQKEGVTDCVTDSNGDSKWRLIASQT